MPVVEPYPISEPLSTAGRVNMNYQIVPFTYIERSTGMRAVMKAERMIVIPDTAAAVYKANNPGDVDTGGFVFNSQYDYRVPINADQTLLAFDNFFNAGGRLGKGDIFRSASQICNMFFYPKTDALSIITGPNWDSNNTNITRFWNGTSTGTGYTISRAAAAPSHYLTGDNSRERIYTTVYPRLTTKSNTFTVHYFVQTLKQVLPPGSASGAWQTWREGVDAVTGEYRGSTIIERYVDPNDPSIPDFTSPAYADVALDPWYKFRVVSNTQFAP